MSAILVSMNSIESSDHQWVIEPLSEKAFESMREALKDPAKLMAALPPEEQQANQEAQQSVIDACNSALRVEGSLWITD